MIKTNQRYIPKDYVEYKPEIGDYPKDLFTVYVNMEKLSAIFYSKKQSTHTFFNRFSSVEAMKEKINRTIGNLMSWEDRKAERKAERKEKMKNLDVSLVKEGDVYHWSGGYNCTRNDYVQVLEVKGKKVTVLKLNKTQVDGDWMNGNVAPVLNNGKEIISMVIRPSYNEGEVILRDTKGYRENYYKWNGKPNWENCD